MKSEGLEKEEGLNQRKLADGVLKGAPNPMNAVFFSCDGVKT